ncbi:hypothetical protein GQ54DRAFT_55378 [Martensiomyces pterosporus]|nr:hypothetical protein GQ54DRAFT_55378 [Martensiomyces pterosporus]
MPANPIRAISALAQGLAGRYAGGVCLLKIACALRRGALSEARASQPGDKQPLVRGESACGEVDIAEQPSARIGSMCAPAHQGPFASFSVTRPASTDWHWSECPVHKCQWRSL